MKNFKMYMCDSCGFSKDQTGQCPYCLTPLAMYTKEDQREYQVDMEDAMRVMSNFKWYV